MKTKNEMTEDAQLVRKLLPMLRRKSWMSDEDHQARLAYMRMASTRLATMEMIHLLRIHEAAWEMEFEESEAAGFRHLVTCEMARRDKLKNYRSIVLPKLHQPQSGPKVAHP
jgi:hypothetical protein